MPTEDRLMDGVKVALQQKRDDGVACATMSERHEGVVNHGSYVCR